MIPEARLSEWTHGSRGWAEPAGGGHGSGGEPRRCFPPHKRVLRDAQGGHANAQGPRVTYRSVLYSASARPSTAVLRIKNGTSVHSPSCAKWSLLISGIRRWSRGAQNRPLHVSDGHLARGHTPGRPMSKAPSIHPEPGNVLFNRRKS